MASVSNSGSFSSLAGKKVAIMTYGSRGDVQPFVALGTRLQQEGVRVLVATNADHLGFVTSFGLKAAGTAGSCREDHECPEFLSGIATGDFGPFFARQAKERAEKEPETSRCEREAVAAFAPDLIYATPLTYQAACRLAGELVVPMVLGSLFPAEAPLSNLGFRPFRPPAHPTLIHWSPELTAVQPWQHASHRVTGFLVVGAQGDECAEDHVFGGAESRKQLEAFLASGDAPVYMGWGSMVVPRETAGLAVRALKIAGLRGVILGGWAKLDAAMLQDTPDAEELMAYAAKNVLFVQNAPHEWLLPRCLVTVHHGGAGTVAAALRAGVPTIVTPCGLDQPENGRVVERSGCGEALPQIASITAEVLAAAMRRCADDTGLRSRCQAMAARLRSEDGLGQAAAEVARYLEQQGSEDDAADEARDRALAWQVAAEEWTRRVVANSPWAQRFAEHFAARRRAAMGVA